MNLFGRKKKKKEPVNDISKLVDGTYYKIADLQAILKKKQLNYSIFSIRDAETWKCVNYSCGKRFETAIEVCDRCGNRVVPPIIGSPRSAGGGKGSGHRKYTKDQIIEIVQIFETAPPRSAS